MKQIVGLLLFGSVLLSCSDEKQQDANSHTGDLSTGHSIRESQITPNQPLQLTDTVLINGDTTTLTSGANTQSYPDTEKAYPALLINTSVYHADEFRKEWASYTWMGLFKQKEQYYLQQVPINTSRVEDAVLDEEGEKTGWEITTAVKDTNLLLLHGLPALTEGPVEVVKVSNDQLKPGDAVSFSFNGNNYQLLVEGDAEKAGPNEVLYKNYRLYFSYTVAGKAIKQLLVSHDSLEEVMPMLLFVGDINRDGLPDIFMDTTWHYNAIIPTLYLSDKEKPDGLLQIVALHMSVGC